MAEPNDRWYGLFINGGVDDYVDFSRKMEYRETQAELRAAESLGWNIILESPTLIILSPKDGKFLWAFYPAK